MRLGNLVKLALNYSENVAIAPVDFSILDELHIHFVLDDPSDHRGEADGIGCLFQSASYNRFLCPQLGNNNYVDTEMIIRLRKG